MSKELNDAIAEIIKEHEELKGYFEAYHELDSIGKVCVLITAKDVLKKKGIKDMDILNIFKPFTAEINRIQENQEEARGLYVNYDTYMFHVHNLDFGIHKYKGIIYDCNDRDKAESLASKLVEDGVISVEKKENPKKYIFCDTKVLSLLEKNYRYVKERNKNLQAQTVILSLKYINFFDESKESR